jgi:hypothetical protein
MRSPRTIPLRESVVQALKLRMEQQDILRERAGEFWEEWGSGVDHGLRHAAVAAQ